MDRTDQARPSNSLSLELDEQEPAGLSTERRPFAGIHAALRKARANDAETKESPFDDRHSSSRGAQQSSGRLRVLAPPVSESAPSESRRTGTELQLSELASLDAEKSKYPNACLAIEYRDDVRNVWDAIGQLSEFVRRELLSALEKNPQVNARELAAAILRKLEEERKRFVSYESSDSYRAAAQIGKDAADEFRRVILLLGPTVDPDEVLVKVEEKYGNQDHPRE